MNFFSSSAPPLCLLPAMSLHFLLNPYQDDVVARVSSKRLRDDVPDVVDAAVGRKPSPKRVKFCCEECSSAKEYAKLYSFRDTYGWAFSLLVHRWYVSGNSLALSFCRMLISLGVFSKWNETLAPEIFPDGVVRLCSTEWCSGVCSF